MQALPIIQMLLAIIVIALILVQERNSGTSGLLGGGGEGTYQARRGLEQVIFVATIASTVAFAGLALAQLYFNKF